MKKKAALHNLGCKVNAYETEAMQELLEQNGYEIVPFKEGADVYIINTCTVTNVADRKSRQMLHKARKMNPDAVVVATGCYVQARGEDIDPCVDIVVGNNKKKDLIAILDEYYNAQHKVKKELLDINHEKEYEEMQVTIQQSIPVRISRSRMGAISSVLTASFRMREDVSEAVTWNMY